MEGIALSALLGAVIAGTGAYIVLGRGTMTKTEHQEVCKLIQVPIEQRLDFLQEAQDRTEEKVDGVSSKIDRVLGTLHKMNGGND